MSRGIPVVEGFLEPAGFQQITNLAGVVTLTPPDGVRLTVLQAETQDVRYRDDGANPTASVGMLLPAEEVLEYNGRPDALRLIEVTASAVLNVSYYR